MDLNAIGDYSNAIEDIYDDKLDAIVIRNAFPLDVASQIVDRLHSDSSLPWLRPNKIGPNTDIHVLGVPATPTFESPGGPDVEAYFDAGAKYDEVIRTVFPDSCNPVSYTEDFLGRVSGGRPVEIVQEAGGRRFASCSLRSLPEGQSIIVHNDHYHFKLPVYATVVSNLDTTISLSFFVVLQAPDGGGELVVHGVTHEDEIPFLPNRMPDAKAIQTRYKFEKFDLAAGDAIVFGAGKFYHHVEPVSGTRPRVTLGGFVAFDRPREKVVYWN